MTSFKRNLLCFVYAALGSVFLHEVYAVGQFMLVEGGSSLEVAQYFLSWTYLTEFVQNIFLYVLPLFLLVLITVTKLRGFSFASIVGGTIVLSFITLSFVLFWLYTYVLSESFANLFLENNLFSGDFGRRFGLFMLFKTYYIVPIALYTILMSTLAFGAMTRGMNSFSK